MQHTIIRDSELNGWEYGMLRSFEQAVCDASGAAVCEIPTYTFLKSHIHHFGQGMNKAKFRRYFPKQPFSVPGDVCWYILMGPENYRLDLYDGWEKSAKTKILYLYDTFPSQYPLIKKLCSNGTWDILITSFNDAVADLEKITNRKWYCIEQAADETLFSETTFDRKLIDFSSYGRRYAAFHDVVKEYSAKKGLYYDYTTHDGKHPIVDSFDLYRQYAWHLNHSLFTFSWPVELTNPSRAGHLHPITCRWFEAMAAGTIILGKKPGNKIFAEWLGEDLVVDVDPNASKSQLFHQLETIWEQREALFARAQAARSKHVGKNSWKERVTRILSLIS